MYELINTSVPNGLIAGTHGFATVATTRGMPDALRVRVENFCAYPHRTGAHDESYYSANPVNWFHLTLPTGDHVVGRTAPAAFDYTGRTNRLAHVLVFPKHEMPSNGGAFVARVAAPRLSEVWQGDPRLLEADRALDAQVRATAAPRSTSPTKWTEVFGPKGAEYARRVALLTAKNMRMGRSLYFKCSPTDDVDGKRLLGLIGEIIDLLPKEVASGVTFSTFAACVPSGVTCHLRGIFDRDRAFDVVSTLQPWIDLEHARVVHEELLPLEQVVPSAAIPSVAAPKEDADRVNRELSSRPRFGRHAATKPSSPRHVPWTAERKRTQFPWVYVLPSAAIVLLSIAGIAGWWLLKGTDVSFDDLQQASKLIESRDDLKEEVESLCQIAGIQSLSGLSNRLAEVTECAQRPEVVQREELKRMLDDAKSRILTRIEEEAKKADRTKLADARAAAEDACKKEEEKERLAQEEANSKRQERQAREERAEWTKTISELVLTDVLSGNGCEMNDGSHVELRDDVEPSDIQDSEPFAVFWYMKDSTIASQVVSVQVKIITDPRARRSKSQGERSYQERSYRIGKVDVGESPWRIIRLVLTNHEEQVYWSWNLPKERKLFEKDDKIPLRELAFGDGDSDDAYQLWIRKFPEFVYVLKTDSKNTGTPRFYDSSRKYVTKDSFVVHGESSQDQAATEQNQRQIRLKEAAIRSCEDTRTNSLERVEMLLREKKKEFDKLKEDLKAARNDKGKQKDLKKKCKDLQTSAYQELDIRKMTGYLDKKVIKGEEVDLGKVNEAVLMTFKSQADDSINDEIKRLELEVRDLQGRLKTREGRRAEESNPQALAFTLEVLKELPADTHEEQESVGDGHYRILQQNDVQYGEGED